MSKFDWELLILAGELTSVAAQFPQKWPPSSSMCLDRFK